MSSIPLACLEDRLQAHPVLRERFETLLAMVEAEGGTLERADDVELRVIEELRRLGHDLLQDWAAGKVIQRTAAVRQPAPAVPGHGQKNSTGIPPSG
jgi:hypothetical protein